MKLTLVCVLATALTANAQFFTNDGWNPSPEVKCPLKTTQHTGFFCVRRGHNYVKEAQRKLKKILQGFGAGTMNENQYPDAFPHLRQNCGIVQQPCKWKNADGVVSSCPPYTVLG